MFVAGVVVLVVQCDKNPGRPFCLLESTARKDSSHITVIAHVDLARISTSIT